MTFLSPQMSMQRTKNSFFVVQAPSQGLGDGVQTGRAAQVSFPAVQAAPVEYCLLLPVTGP